MKSRRFVALFMALLMTIASASFSASAKELDRITERPIAIEEPFIMEEIEEIEKPDEIPSEEESLPAEEESLLPEEEAEEPEEEESEEIEITEEPVEIEEIEELESIEINEAATLIPAYFDEEWLSDELAGMLSARPYYDESWDENETWILTRDLSVRQDTFLICAQQGLSIRDSVTKARLMQQLHASFDEVLDMIALYGSEEAAQAEALRMMQLRGQSPLLNSDAITEVADYVLQGYPAENAMKAFVVSRALEVDMDVVMAAEEVVAVDRKIVSEALVLDDAIVRDDTLIRDDALIAEDAPVARREMVKSKDLVAVDLAEEDSAKTLSLAELVPETISNEAEALQKIAAFNEENKISFASEKSAVMTRAANAGGGDFIGEEEVPTAPFSYRAGVNETINLNSGALIHEETLVSLPGKNGHDLNLVLQYDSQAGTGDSSDWYGNIASPNLSLDQFAASWSLKLNCIGYSLGYYYLILADGGSYKITEVENNLFSRSPVLDYPYGPVYMQSEWYGSMPSNVTSFATYPDGARDYFDSSGRLTKSVDRFGNSITYQRNTSYMTITDSVNRTVTIQCNPASSTTGEPANITISQSFNNIIRYNLASQTVTNPNGTSYTYWSIASKVDRLGRTTTYDYTLADKINSDKYYLLKKITYPTGLTSNYTYNAKYYTHWGAQYKYYQVANRYEQDPNTPNKKYNYEWYSFANMRDESSYTHQYQTIVTNWDNIQTTYTFDTTHRKTMVYQQNFDEVDPTPDFVSEEKWTRYSYGAASAQKTLPVRISTDTRYGNVTTYSIEAYEYDSFGNVSGAWSTHADGDTDFTTYKTTYTYDPTYNLPTSKTYNSGNMKVIREEYTLDANNKHILSAQVTENNVPQSRTDYTYDTSGRMTTERNYYDSQNYIQTSYTYATNGLLASSTTGGVTESYTYNHLGWLTTFTDGNGGVTSYLYDALGRSTKVTNPDGTFTTTQYNDAQNTRVETNANAAALLYTYDKLGNLASIVDPVTNDVLCSYTYDSMMRVATETDANGQSVTYTYDDYGRVSTVSYPGGAQETYVYQNNGVSYSPSNTFRVDVFTSGTADAPATHVATYTDVHGRVIQESVFENGVERATTYTYDHRNNKLSERSARDAAASRAYTNLYEYDWAGRVVKLQSDTNVIYRTAYDWLGRQTAVTDPKGSTATYVYDDRGQVITETLPFDGVHSTVKQYAYDDNGNT